jgi:hypothetical protein
MRNVSKLGARIPRLFVIASTLVGWALAPAPARAAVIMTTAADQAVFGLNSGATSANVDGGTALAAVNVTTARAGSVGGATPPGRSYVIPFQLPNLGPGSPFLNASLTVNYALGFGAYPNGTNANFNADVYGLGQRANSAVQTGDYFQGFAGGTDATDATMIQDNWLTPLLVTPANGTPLSTVPGLLDNYLNTQYANGANAGNFVFLRISADGDSTTNDIAYSFFTFDQGTAGGGAIPTITYTVAPEPASLGFLGLVSLAAFRRRSRVGR